VLARRPRTASQVGRAANAKGKTAERELLAMLRPLVERAYETMAKHGYNVGPPPRLQRNTLQADKGGADAIGLPWLALEIKNCEVQPLHKWWQQCVKQAEDMVLFSKYDSLDRVVPVLIYKRNSVPWRVRMRGQLPVDSGPNHVHAIIDTDLPTFLQWFERRCMYEAYRALPNYPQ